MSDQGKKSIYWALVFACLAFGISGLVRSGCEKKPVKLEGRSSASPTTLEQPALRAAAEQLAQAALKSVQTPNAPSPVLPSPETEHSGASGYPRGAFVVPTLIFGGFITNDGIVRARIRLWPYRNTGFFFWTNLPVATNEQFRHDAPVNP